MARHLTWHLLKEEDLSPPFHTATRCHQRHPIPPEATGDDGQADAAAAEEEEEEDDDDEEDGEDDDSIDFDEAPLER